MKRMLPLLICMALISFIQPLQAAKVMQLKVVDKDYLLVYFIDGEVQFDENITLPSAYTNDTPSLPKNKVVWYGEKLNTEATANPQNWTIVSSDDPNYGTEGLSPVACYRKSKIYGMAEMEWKDKDYRYECPMEHSIYLKLPNPLIKGKTYTIKVDKKTHADVTSSNITFDIFNSRTEAIHVNLVGYLNDASIKSADLYQWMGDGDARDYSTFEGKKVYLYDVKKKKAREVGKVAPWQANAPEAGGYNLTGSKVWNIDFTGTYKPGTYRLAVEDVGCSEDFIITKEAYAEPFRLSTIGFFYMRIGQDNMEMNPVPRRPLYIPGKSPENTKVIMTTMHPYHAEWKTFSRGDVWDTPNAWAKYNKPGNPENPHVYGGHADAMDWDRHSGHISIIYDMLLPYILTNGAISDDNTGIAESGNGIPDILDEARNEVDFWLRLRDGKGYSHGVTNPNKDNVLYQAGCTAISAWANAANAAMMSQCFQIAGNKELMSLYKDSAIVAYRYAETLEDQQLDTRHGIGDGSMRGRDLKMTAAAYLYNVTGDVAWEKVISEESNCKSNASEILNSGINQSWATAAYLVTKQKVNYPELQQRMKSSLINEAKTLEANMSLTRPSRRATDHKTGYWKTNQNVQRSIIAHAVTTDKQEKKLFKNAMILEADWGLGRNPLNMIQMTTATTPLQNKRSVQEVYATGRNDGAPGVHPGLTPYQNTDDWGKGGMIMSAPSWMTAQCYPDYNSKWPKAEGYFNTRYIYAHSEFTPQQTMRGKMALYGYLYGISK
ncbi:MAG TPA: cellulase N-terminal Ig-like domain-containing protein [Prolixibacteraceae bacterium]|nr:cellulase N-terminal Ig-like domain-containing protein [Prolixibacteraceae bacterium]